MLDREIKYGVNLFLNEVSIESLGKADSIKSPKFKYIVEFAEGESNNGNGHQFMKIYTDGELKVLEIGNWKISPIVKMPYDWTGFWVKVDISDLNNAITTIHHKPDNSTQPGKIDFVPDIEYVFESINELFLIEDMEHFDVLKSIKETARRTAIVKKVWIERSVPFKNIAEIAGLIANNIVEYDKVKGRLKPEFSDYLKLKLNSLIETYSTIEAELIN